jgi:hypothetical protein
VSQKSHSLVILTDLLDFFNVGHINIDNKNTDAYKFVVSKTDDLVKVIIPHFDKYPLICSKNLDYLD